MGKKGYCLVVLNAVFLQIDQITASGFTVQPTAE